MSTEALFWAIKQPVGDVYEKAVLWVLADLANKKQNHSAWPSLDTIARETRISKRKVQGTIKALVARKLVEPQGSDMRRSYRLMLENDYAPREPQPADHGTACMEHGTACIEHGTACHQSFHDPVKYPSDANARENASKAKPGRAPYQARAGRAASDDPWIGRVQAFRERGFWIPDWGLPPGSERGCRVPPQVLQRFGYG